MKIDKHSFSLLQELTKKEIKIRYKNSYLGYLWSLANPLMLAIVFYFVFQVVARIEMENYALFLVTGLFVWQWMTNSLQLGTMVFVGNAGLIKKVNFDKTLLVSALVLSEGFNFFFSLPIILAFMFYEGLMPTVMWLVGIPIMFAITGVFIYGLSLIVGTVNLFFRDMERVIMVLLILLFYATPVLYPVAMIPEDYSYILYLNPFASFVISWRAILLDGEFDIEFMFVSLAYAFLVYVIGLFVYSKLKTKFAELI